MRQRIRERIGAIQWGKLLLDLAVVFVGVYAAFLLNGYQEDRRAGKERERVLALMRVGVDRYEKLFGGFVLRHENLNAQFRELLERGEIPDFSDTYYPAPQYPITVLRHVMTQEGYDVFPVEIYVPLNEFASALERLMYVEEKLVELSAKFTPLPDAGHPDHAMRREHLLLDARRYLTYLDIRKRTSQDLQERARDLGRLFAAQG